MKFFALIASAVALQLDALNKPPTASQVMHTCDANGNGWLNFKEVKKCLTSAVAHKVMTEDEAKEAGEALTKHAQISKRAYFRGAKKLGYTRK